MNRSCSRQIRFNTLGYILNPKIGRRDHLPALKNDMNGVGGRAKLKCTCSVHLGRVKVETAGSELVWCPTVSQSALNVSRHVWR